MVHFLRYLQRVLTRWIHDSAFDDVIKTTDDIMLIC